MKPQMVPPRIKQLSPRRAATVAALDVGTSKIACLVARLTPVQEPVTGDWRTHRARILGIGHQRSRGVKNGLVVDMDEAESAIRLTVDAAERMAGVQVERILVAASGGRLGSQHFTAKTQIGGREVVESDVHRVLEASANHSQHRGRVPMHSMPTGFSLDGAAGIRDPKSMIGDELGVELHVVELRSGGDAQSHSRDRTWPSPYRSHRRRALHGRPVGARTDDEAEMGVVVIDIGGGSTSIAVFAGGVLTHVDAVTLGGNHVTMDIARGLDARLSDAERLKTFHGAAIASPSDERETITFDQVGERGEHPVHIPKSHLVRIIRPRVDETIELVRDRLARAGYPAGASRRVVLTGGASQLTGSRESRCAAFWADRCGSDVRSASRDFRSRRRAPPSRWPSVCWSIRRSPDANISNLVASSELRRGRMDTCRAWDGGSWTVSSVKKSTRDDTSSGELPRSIPDYYERPDNDDQSQSARTKGTEAPHHGVRRGRRRLQRRQQHDRLGSFWSRFYRRQHRRAGAHFLARPNASSRWVCR